MAELIRSIAAVLWPLLVLFIVLTFRRTLHRILDSIERREIEIDVGGQRLTLRQLNDQQSKLITDLQRQVALLSKVQDASAARGPDGHGAVVPDRGPGESEAESRPVPLPQSGGPLSPQPVPVPPAARPPGPTVPGPGDPGPADPGSAGHRAQADSAAPDAPMAGSPQALLWVDDHPEGIALLVEQLQDNGTRVDLARSTNEALDRLAHRRYRLIVSDMARLEGGSYDSAAGIGLIRELRDTGIETPVVVYCGQQSRIRNEHAAREAGAIAVTDSSVQLFEQLQTFHLL